VAVSAAEAAPTCLKPAELKLLKTAVLEQALATAAQSCHLEAAHARFRAVYRADLQASDRALKGFFASRKSGETYTVYKARIGREIAGRSHDAKFCRAAGVIFAIALNHEKASPPSLGATGYEHCAMPGIPSAPQHPLQIEAASVSPSREMPPVPSVRPQPVTVATAVPLRLTAPLHSNDAQKQVESPAQSPVAEHDESWREASNVDLSSLADAADEGSPYKPGDPVPNAYKPGAVWISAAAQPVPPAQYQPRPPNPDVYLGIDGRWHPRPREAHRE
jgi:hypothetical protein